MATGYVAQEEHSPSDTETKPEQDEEVKQKMKCSVRPFSPTSYGAIKSKYYVIQGHNAANLVDEVLKKWNWIRLGDKLSTAFTLKWTELKQSIDYRSFREGDQLVNHFPNISLLTTKIGLLESLRSNKRRLLSLRLIVDQIIPETYRLDVISEREEFFQNYKKDELWICKPTHLNQGKGIFLVKNLEQIQDKLLSDKANCRSTVAPTQRIVQKYISQPLLLEGRKFDIRVYMLLIAGEKVLYAFYHEGYIRLSCLQYDIASGDITVHLTNQYVQKKHPTYNDIKEDTVWDFAKFQSYLTSNEGLPHDWVANVLTKQLKRIMLGCYHSIYHRLEQRIGYFELLGFDFLVDSNYHVWLIEVNINPAMHVNCDTLKKILPQLIEETLNMAVEIWSKSRRSKQVFPISAQKNFVTIFP